MRIDAITPVKTKTESIQKTILPNFLASVMPATVEAIEKKTRGTTAVNSKLSQSVPIGFINAATLGKSGPKRRPAIAAKRRNKEPLWFLRIFFIKLIIGSWEGSPKPVEKLWRRGVYVSNFSTTKLMRYSPLFARLALTFESKTARC